MQLDRLAIVLALTSLTSAVSAQDRQQQIVSAFVETELATGLEFERQGHPNEAEPYFARAVNASPAHIPSVLALARVEMLQGRTEQARALLLRTPTRGEIASEHRIAMAHALRDVHEINASLAVLQVVPARPELEMVQVEIAAKAGRFPFALTVARRLAAMSGNDSMQTRARELLPALQILAGILDPVSSPLPAALQSPVRRALRRSR